MAAFQVFRISSVPNPKVLGITFDQMTMFNSHTNVSQNCDKIKKKKKTTR